MWVSGCVCVCDSISVGGCVWECVVNLCVCVFQESWQAAFYGYDHFSNEMK